jgi:serine-type D-Ala-D-Ala carboxypeptidase/endopeptidase (penicillin-binding protein 4)
VRRLRAAALLTALAVSGACATHAGPLDSPATQLARVGPASPAVRELQTDLSTVFGAPVTAHATWAIDVRSLDTGETLFRLNAGKLMMPASNMKIVTLAAAAEVLGWDHRFTTTLETAAPVAGGVLQGDLFVRGTGDPSINTRDERATRVLDEWASALRLAGITHIAGRIVGDDQAFDDETLGAGWSWDYLHAGYAAPIGALQFNENVARMTVKPGAAPGAPVEVTIGAGSGFTIVNHAVTGSGDAVESLTYRRLIDRPVLEIRGTVPAVAGADGRMVTRTVAVINPTLFFVQSLKDGLIARGITVSGEAVDFDDIAAEFSSEASIARRVLATTESPTLREIGTVLMKVSQNQYAETLMKAVGAARGGLGTAAAGRRATARLLGDWGMPPEAFVLSDGSGLSRYNYLSASALTAVLERMYRDEQHREPFLAAMPIAGRDGTISARMRGTRAEGNVLAKTGSIANVRSLSGYVRTRDGEQLVFAIVANDFVTPTATITWMADLTCEILSNFTRAQLR